MIFEKWYFENVTFVKNWILGYLFMCEFWLPCMNFGWFGWLLVDFWLTLGCFGLDFGWLWALVSLVQFWVNFRLTFAWFGYNSELWLVLVNFELTLGWLWVVFELFIYDFWLLWLTLDWLLFDFGLTLGVWLVWAFLRGMKSWESGNPEILHLFLKLG